jgi:hypothetical protein
MIITRIISQVVISSTAAVEEKNLWNPRQIVIGANGSDKIIYLEFNAPFGLNYKSNYLVLALKIKRLF